MSAVALAAQGLGPLVSVVPPDGQISPDSRIREDARGKAPGKHGPKGWYGYDFTKPENAPSPEQIDAWGCNIGLLADHWPALDIDVDNERLAEVVKRFAFRVLGEAPVRFSRPPRMLLMYRADEPFPKRALKITYEGEEHTVEFLGQGRQYLIAGTHPSGLPYRWDQPLVRELVDGDDVTLVEDLVRVSDARVDEFFATLQEALESKGIECERVGRNVLEKSIPPQEDLLAPSIEDLRSLVGRLPNDYPDRDTYIGIGHAIRAAAGEDEAGAQIFQDWAAKWDGGHNDPDVVESDYRSFKGPYRVGWPNLEREVYGRAQELLTAKEELQLAEKTVRELEAVMPPGLDAFQYEDGPPPYVWPGLNLIHIDTMLGRERMEQEWVVDGLLPQGGLGLIAAKPKVGKTTLARALAVAVAKGEPFLGRDTTQGPVVYISLEDPAWHVQAEFERLGAKGSQLYVFEGPVPGESDKLLWESVAALRPVLVIVDTAQRWLQIRDLNDYAEVTAALTPHLSMARELQSCLLYIHHAPKGGTGDVGDTALGSTALFGSVDIGIFLTRDTEGRRFLTTRQRIQQEPDIESMSLEIDPVTHQVRLGSARNLKLLDEIEQRIMAYVNEYPGANKTRVQEDVEGSAALIRRGLERLVERGRLTVEGRGVSGSPACYTAAVSDFDADINEEVIA